MMVDTKKVSAIIFFVKIKKEGSVNMGRPKGGKNTSHSKEEK